MHGCRTFVTATVSGGGTEEGVQECVIKVASWQVRN